MKYNEAKQHKDEAVKNADENVLQNFHIIITPTNTDDSAKYIEDFLKNPDNFNDKSCQKYCSDDEYEVVSFRKDDDTKNK